jgi:FlaA1/EpsC-like NDP-sugar epimerase
MATSEHLLRDTSPTWWGRIAQRSVRGPADVVLVGLDVVLVTTAYAMMLLVRYELTMPVDAWSGLLKFLPFVLVAHVAANRVAGVYGPVWDQASILEAKRILLAGAAVTLFSVAGLLVAERSVPLSVAVTGGVVATGLMGVLRFQSRLFAFRRHGDDGLRVIVVGAGESAGAILRELARHDEQEISIVGLLDDDPRKLGRWLGGVPIVGTVDQLVECGRLLDADQVLLAIPSADSTLIRQVADSAAQLALPLKVLPSVSELMNGQPRLRDVRDLSIDDLLGRQQVSTDLASVQALIRGRRVLVTGGGGSIGSEIVRQVAAYEPSRLLVLDRDETHLFDSLASVGGDAVPVLLDIRDRQRLVRMFLAERPDIIFHAAANKHVPLLESHPGEAAATNVFGTSNLVQAARAAGVSRVVFVSTDKAVNPQSVMGASKRVGEQLVLTGAPAGAGWCAVRFGNVLGSRGSVVPTFVRQIREGGPVTVTHPDMTRYFMSIPEAVQLVLQAAAFAEDREVFMLDMGQPVRIVDLATRMISLAGLRVGTDIAIEVTGPRPGEKLTEELHTADERPLPTTHPKIVRLRPQLLQHEVLSVCLADLTDALEGSDDDAIRRILFGLSRNGHAASKLMAMETVDVNHD